jgi:hypothetical protein
MDIFHGSKHILCQIHLVDNVISKISECHLTLHQDSILESIFGTRVAGERSKGLIDLSGDEFESELFGLLEHWRDLGDGGVKFANYFEVKAELLRQHYSVRKL